MPINSKIEVIIGMAYLDYKLPIQEPLDVGSVPDILADNERNPYEAMFVYDVTFSAYCVLSNDQEDVPLNSISGEFAGHGSKDAPLLVSFG